MKRGRTTPTPAIPLVVSLKHAILDKTSMKGTTFRKNSDLLENFDNSS